MQYDPRTRFVRGGELRLLDGVRRGAGDRGRGARATPASSSRPPATATGQGHIHGAWRGALHLDGEHIADCWDDEHLRLLGQFRDTPIRVREGDAVGYGIMESIISGDWPELGLTAESDRRVAHA